VVSTASAGEATKVIDSAKIYALQLKKLVKVYKISRCKLATCFTESFKIIAIVRITLFSSKCTANLLAAGQSGTPQELTALPQTS